MKKIEVKKACLQHLQEEEEGKDRATGRDEEEKEKGVK